MQSSTIFSKNNITKGILLITNRALISFLVLKLYRIGKMVHFSIQKLIRQKKVSGGRLFIDQLRKILHSVHRDELQKKSPGQKPGLMSLESSPAHHET
jgi:hypothetical protein